MQVLGGLEFAPARCAPYDGVNTFEDVALCYTTGDRGSQMPLLGDWDASGEPDIAFPSPDDDGFFLVPGEDLPWDDPTMW